MAAFLAANGEVLLQRVEQVRIALAQAAEHFPLLGQQRVQHVLLVIHALPDRLISSEELLQAALVLVV